MGGGRGAGRGMGRGMGFPTLYDPIQSIPLKTEMNENNVKGVLKKRLKDLEIQLKEVKKRLEEIE